LSVYLRRDNIASFNWTKLKLKTNIGTKLYHFDTWQNYGMTHVKINKKLKIFTKN